MSKMVRDYKQYKDLSVFEDLLEEARMAADDDASEGFVAKMIDNFKQWQDGTFLSEKQHDWLLRIAEWDD